MPTLILALVILAPVVLAVFISVLIALASVFWCRSFCHQKDQRQNLQTSYYVQPIISKLSNPIAQNRSVSKAPDLISSLPSVKNTVTAKKNRLAPK